MRPILSMVALAALSATAAVGQTTPAPAPMTAAPQPGANSFTQGEAKSRLEKAGYSDVSGLTKDDQGIWRGTASKNGKAVKVSLDYKGNISEN
jgi:putative membrane protein